MKEKNAESVRSMGSVTIEQRKARDAHDVESLKVRSLCTAGAASAAATQTNSTAIAF